MNNHKPIFIIGLPRSGTKLLREILNRHNLISIPKAETGFIPFFWEKRSFYGNLSDRQNFKKFFNDFKKTSFYYHIKLADQIWTESIFFNHVQNHQMINILEAIFRLHADFEKKPIWGDKTPEYIYHTRLIKHLFPEARFVHIIRDVRDYCLSIRKAWNKNIFRAAQKWVDAIDFVKKETRHINSDYYELKYEELIDNPTIQISKLCNWLGINFTLELFNLNNQVENLGDAKNKKGIVSKNYNKWKIEFSPYEIKKIESISGQLLSRLGYCVSCSKEQRRLSKTENLFYCISDIFNLFIFRTKEYKSPIMATLRMLRDLKTKISQGKMH